MLKNLKLKNSQDRNSGSDIKKNNKEMGRRRVNIEESSNGKSSTEDDSRKPSYTQKRRRRRESAPQSLEIVRRIINYYRLSFSGETKQAEEFLEALLNYYKTSNVSFELWLQLIRRVFKGKAREWFKNNIHYMTSWKKLKRMLKERHFGLYDEDDMLDDLRIRVQRKGKSISDFVDKFIYLVSRLRHPPPVHTHVAIAFKKLLPEYRSHCG